MERENTHYGLVLSDVVKFHRCIISITSTHNRRSNYFSVPLKGLSNDEMGGANSWWNINGHIVPQLVSVFE